MNMSNATKYAARDSATSALRKIGVTKSDYDDFIVRRDGTFYCDIEGAKKFVAKNGAPAAAAPAATETKAAKPAAVKVEKKQTGTSAIIRAKILAGMTNQQIWDEMSSGKNPVLGANQKHYPAWYRCELRRKGHTGI
jgi:hypothetical protein